MISPAGLVAAIVAFALTIEARAEVAVRPWEQWSDCNLVADHFFDGDSFPIRHARRTYVLRLYFVDAPETDTAYEARIREQAAYFGVTPEQAVAAGLEAKAFTAKFLASPFRVITRLKSAPGASRIQRTYAIVERGGERLEAALVQAGLARVTSIVADFPDPEAGHKRELELRALEQKAAQDRTGLWAKSQRRDRGASLIDTIKQRLHLSSGPGVRKVGLNSASQADLEALPGIGSKTAGAIIRARPVRSFEQLDTVPNIGPKKIEALRGLVSFD